MADVKVGYVGHYFDKISVAVVKLTADLKVGDKIKFVHDGEDMFEQKVDSLQVDHKNVDVAKKNSEVGLKTVREVKEGFEVYRIA